MKYKLIKIIMLFTTSLTAVTVSALAYTPEEVADQFISVTELEGKAIEVTVTNVSDGPILVWQHARDMRLLLGVDVEKNFLLGFARGSAKGPTRLEPGASINIEWNPAAIAAEEGVNRISEILLALGIYIRLNTDTSNSVIRRTSPDEPSVDFDCQVTRNIMGRILYSEGERYTVTCMGK